MSRRHSCPRRSREALRSEAAAWVSRLKDSHSQPDRRAFEIWLARDPEHRGAYDRAAAAYEAAGALRRSETGRGRDLEAAFAPRRGTVAGRLATAGVLGLVLLGAYLFASDRHPFAPVPVAAVMLSTTDQPRNVLLADGSRLSIAPASEVRIVLGRAGRLAEIRKGRVRVAVKAENRPFVIVAGRSRVEADEGVFDARLVEGDGTVAPARSAWTAGAPAAGQPAGGAHPHMEFAAEPLGQAVVRVNGLHAGPPIEIEPALAGLPVTGIVDRGGSRSIAQSLAAAFDLDLVETSAGALRLQRRKDDQQSSRTWRRPARPGPAFS